MDRPSGSNDVLFQLLKAKQHSDRGEFNKKKAIIAHLLAKHPDQFRIDSRQTHTVGLTHKATRFKIHAVKSALPPGYLHKQAGLPQSFLNAVKRVINR